MQAYHIFPEAVMRALPGYKSEEAPAVLLAEHELRVACETLELAFAYCRQQGITRLSFRDLFTMVAGSLLKAGIAKESMQQMVGYAADWFLANPKNWATTLNPETGKAWLDSLKIPEP